MGTMTFSAQTPKVAATEMTMTLTGKYKELAYAVPELDTARMYNEGLTEVCVGEILNEACPELKASDGIKVATKANPTEGLSAEKVKAQLNKSLEALNMDSVDIFYLHLPDPKVKIEESLESVQALYEEGKFKRFGLSNYSAWEVAYIHGYMKDKGWCVKLRQIHLYWKHKLIVRKMRNNFHAFANHFSSQGHSSVVPRHAEWNHENHDREFVTGIKTT